MAETLTRPLLHRVMGRAARHHIPFQVTMELTYQCNLWCKHCYVDMRPTDELSLSELKDVLAQLSAAGSLYLLLTGGEPLARPDFFDFAAYARKQGFILMLLTNGTLITPAAAREIASLKPLFVNLSLYGATPATHEGVTGSPGSLAATVRAVRLLTGLGVRVSLQASLMDSNVHEAGAMRGLAGSLGVPLRLAHEMAPTKSGALTPQRHEVGLDELDRCVEPDWIGKAEPAYPMNGVCKAGRGMCSISPTGDVFPCIMMPLKLGNLRETRFSDIWRSKPTPELTYLRSITSNDLSTCNSCQLSEFCQRCMGVALSETGHLTRPAPSACRYAALKYQVFTGREVRHERGLPEAPDDHREG